ncbi:hypothetical protein TSUD_208240 [Trifolium subterraneum]|uniref:K-box domain-containing protein n=1 Tax=Trifolium subterraneum TaxID=3900 RepID=A0A2Z6MTM8_TRISU|nr:hypothetical protein TSUD_208240 [Trifolium subterraneum]
MTKTVEKYHKYSYNELQTNQSANATQNYQDYERLKANVEILQRSQRNLLGEDIAQMNTTELEQLENQLEAALMNIRSTKTQFMLDQLADLHNRETQLVEKNNALRNKLEETDHNSQVPDRMLAVGSNFPPQSHRFSHHVGVNSNLQFG